MTNCHACGLPIEGARVRATFDGFDTLKLNGVTFVLHARCIQLVFPDRDVKLPERISDPVAERKA